MKPFSEQDDKKVKIKQVEGEKVSNNSGEDRSVGLQENIQDRFELRHPGDMQITLKNYEGKAIEGLSFQIVSSPPPNAILWGFGIFFSILGIYYESWKKCDKVAGDIAFLAFYGLFLSQEVAPLDGIKGMVIAAAPAFFDCWTGAFSSPTSGATWVSAVCAAAPTASAGGSPDMVS